MPRSLTCASSPTPVRFRWCGPPLRRCGPPFR